MKKHILALLFLLLILIVTCVYQHTYTLYSEAHADYNTSMQSEQEIITIKSEETKIPVKQQKIVETPTNTVHKESPTEETSPTLVEKITNAVIAATTSESKEATQTPKKVVHEEVKTDKTLTTMNTQKEEKEVIDYLLTVMNERDEALTNRDEAEANMHALIKKVLEERRVAIENMHQVSLQIDQEHQKRLTERDTLSQNNSQEKGK